ncbi:MAG: GNAT family N-acetyltransferase [Inquilinaceae bacterium]
MGTNGAQRGGANGVAIAEILETERLILRRHLPDDAAEIARLLDDWEVVRWLAQVPYPYTEQDALEWIAQTNRNWVEGKDFQFVVVLRDGGEMVGHMGLRVDSNSNGAELGYWFGQAHWGLGFGAEAALAVVDFGFHCLGLERIWATYLPENHRSLNVLQKVGLVEAGRKRQEFSTLGRTVECALLAIRRHQYFGAREAS